MVCVWVGRLVGWPVVGRVLVVVGLVRSWVGVLARWVVVLFGLVGVIGVVGLFSWLVDSMFDGVVVWLLCCFDVWLGGSKS